MERWCQLLNEVERFDAQVIYCEDLVLLRIVADYIVNGRAGVTKVQGFARGFLGITSPGTVYKVLERLCRPGFIKLLRSKRRKGGGCGLDDECSFTGSCYVTGIKPTMVGVVTAAASSFQLAYKDVFTALIGKYNRLRRGEVDLANDIIRFLFNEGLRDEAWGAIRGDEEARKTMGIYIDRIDGIYKEFFGDEGGLAMAIPSLGIMLGFHNPFTSFMYKHSAYTGFGRDALKYAKPVLRNVLMVRLRARVNKAIRLAVYEQLMNAIDSNDPDRITTVRTKDGTTSTWQYIIMLARSLRV